MTTKTLFRENANGKTESITIRLYGYEYFINGKYIKITPFKNREEEIQNFYDEGFREITEEEVWDFYEDMMAKALDK